MATFDLVIRNAEVHDGLGSEPRIADIGVSAGRIAAIGEGLGSGEKEFDATGLIATPGFVDIHTHYDGQATWENRLSPSSNHGVTTVVMGNCGVGFAPCRPHQRDMLVELMEGVEDIPEVVMTEGLPWNWETFPQYLDALAARPLDVDVCAQAPHSALRVYVMGERGARREAPTADDLDQMRALTAEAVRAGAFGVSTSRNMLHRTRAGDLAPSLHSEVDELVALGLGLKDAGAGVFQLIVDIVGDADVEFDLMEKVAEASGRPLSFSLLQMPVGEPGLWRRYLHRLEAANDRGLEMRAQVYPRPVGMLYGLDLSFHAFSLHPSFQALNDLSVLEKVQAMRDPRLKAQLLSETPEHTNPVSIKTVQNFTFTYLMGDPPNYTPDPTDRLDHQAALRGLSPLEYAYDLLVENEGRNIFFLPGANYRDANLDAVREMTNHQHTVMALGDGGAHYGMICDASFTTFYLQNEVRDAPPERKVALKDAVKALTSEPAATVGLKDRGRLEVGLVADINLIDLASLTLHAPTIARDLPAGGRRLKQEADGYVATFKNGVATYQDGAPTGALPGGLVRNTAA